MDLDSDRHFVRNLHLFWIEFLNCDCEKTKKKWLELFIFEYNNKLNELHDNQFYKRFGFLSTVPSQLTIYTLQLVYAIICASFTKSTTDTPTELNDTIVGGSGGNDAENYVNTSSSNINGTIYLDDRTSVSNLENDKKKFAAGKPNDIQTIVALREFLIYGIGGKILDLLIRIDTKSLLCARELISLLVNLFPTSSWDINLETATQPNNTITDYETLDCAIKKLENLKLICDADSSLRTDENNDQIKSSDPESIENGFDDINSTESPENYQNEDYEKFSKQAYTSDCIGSMVVNLITKLIFEEKDRNIDKGSITVQCIQFGLEKLLEIQQSPTFSSVNREKIQRKLLTLICLCLKNIFAAQTPFMNLIDIALILNNFLDTLKNCVILDTESSISNEILNIRLEIISSLIYIIFLILQFVLKFAADALHICLNLFRLMKANSDCLSNILQHLLTYQKHIPTSMLQNLTESMCELIYLIRQFDSIFNPIKRRPRRKRIEKELCTHHHHATDELACILENILLKIAQQIEGNNLSRIFQFFQKNPICCCNSDIKSVELLLTNSKPNGFQADCLQFIKNNFLKNLYSNIECYACDTKRSDEDIGTEFVHLYSSYVSALDTADMIIFLKHIIKISKYLPFDVSLKIFVDVVLPPFRHEKQKIFTENGIQTKNQVQRSKDIISCCLNVFLCYLKDLRLIKGFYNVENVQDLYDLIVVPEFASLCCCLLKIGLENLTFLGENPEEQSLLAERLYNLQSNILEDISDILVWLFDEISALPSINLKFKQSDEPVNVETNTKKIASNRLVQLIKVKQLSIKNILHLAVVYWNLILQLFRTNVHRRTSFQQIFQRHRDIVFQLVFSSLSCYLYTKRETSENDELHSAEIETNIHKIRLNEFSLIRQNIFRYGNPKLDWIDVNCIDDDPFNLNYKRPGIIYIQSELNVNELVSVDYDLNFVDPLGDSILNDQCFSSNRSSCGHDHHDQSQDNLISIGIQKIQQFLNFGSVYEIFFSKSVEENKQVQSTTDETKSAANDYINIFPHNEIILFDTTDYKKLFLQLFEITCGIMMSKQSQQLNDATMSTAAKELKLLLTKYSFTITDSNENGKLIISALQSLLKVAEMRYNCCFIEKCSHSTYARRSRFALNATIDVNNQCCESQQNPSEDTNDLDNSDVEQSEEDTTTTSDETFLTADEGYDGDAEQASFNDSDLDESSFSRSSVPAVSRYRSHIIHDGICRIVIDILIDLSKRCIQDPYFWPNYLMQIATRFTVIRESIGGSLHLIRGFAPVLESHDIRLRDFQKSILELITEINTPDTLSAYLNIMTSDTAPIDLLLPRLVYLSGFSSRVQPSYEIEFPTENDDTMRTTCDPLLVKDIKNLHDYHEYHNLKSPFTQSTYLIPLNYINFSVWNPHGFTITTWIKFNGCVTKDFEPEDTNAFIKKDETERRRRNMTHLFSIGSNKILFSIYIDSADSNHLYFQLSKPNGHINDQRGPNSLRNSADASLPGLSTRKKCKASCACLFRKKRRNVVPFDKDKETNSGDKITRKDLNVELQPSTSAETNVQNKNRTIKTAKNLLKNSFGQFNIFSSIGHHNMDDDAENNYFTQPMEVKNIKLPKNKWTNLAISVGLTQTKELAIRITIDGCDHHDIHLPCAIVSKKEKFQILCIGQKQKSPNKCDNEAETEFNNQYLPYSISNVLVFRKCLKSTSVLTSLVALGPDCINFSENQVNNLIPNIGFLNQQKFPADNDLTANLALNILQENLVAVYSAHKPQILVGYNFIEAHGMGEAMGLITLGRPAEIKNIKSLQSAVILSGGLSVLLYLFARVVEMSNSEFIQSSALLLLLRTAHSNSILYTEFMRKDYTNLIGPIIRSNKCIKDIHLLNSILETACDIPVLTTRSDKFFVIPSTQACIVYPNLLISVINHYSDWHKTSNDDSDILDILFGVIQAMVREKHPKQCLNIARLSSAGIVKALLKFCKIYLVGISQPVYLSTRAAESLVNLISIFAGAPPPSSLLDDVTKLLLLLHRPSDSFITHDRSKYYFLLSATVMTKQKRLSLPNAARTLSLSMRRERKNAQPLKLHISKVQRSVSLDSPQVSIEEDDDRRFFYRRKIKPNGNLSQMNETSEKGIDDADEKENNSVLSTPTVLKTTIFQTTSSPLNFADQTLESIANCSRLNGNALKIFTSNNGSSTKLEKALLNMQIRRQAGARKRIQKKGRPRVRTRSMRSNVTENSEYERESQRISSVSESGIEEDMIQDFVIIASDDVKTIEESIRSRSSNSTRDFDFKMNVNSVIQTQIGLFNLLKDFILILPDSSIQEVLTHFVTFDIILVMSNHYDGRVRASIIRLLAVMCERLNKLTVSQFTKSYYWYHLGNQVSLHLADLYLIQVCAQWITGSCLPLEQIVFDQELKIVESYGFNPLMALLPQTAHDTYLSKLTIRLIEKAYQTANECQQYLIDNGLLPAIIKFLMKFYEKWASTNEKSLKYIHNLYVTVAQLALLSTKSINILWDLLNGLSHVEETKNKAVFRGTRIAQAIIFLELFEIFLPREIGPLSDNFKFSVSTFSPIECSLSLAERKTRFDLLVDRIVQFITNVDPSHIPTEQETKLIQSIVMLSVTGYQRGSNVIPWGLCPSRPITLKCYIIRALRKHMKKGHLPFLVCDGKLVKTLTQSFLETDGSIISPLDMQALMAVCNSMGISPSSSCNISQTLEKLHMMRENSIKDQFPAIQRTIFKFESIAQSCIDSAMKITRDVVELQNMERRVLMNGMRSYDESGMTSEWKMIIDRMTHEGAPWHCPKSYPNSWQLDQTEGPSRVRMRFRRCSLDIDRKFFASDIQEILDKKPHRPPLSYLNESFVRRPNFALNDQVLYTFICKYLPIDCEIDGEIIITESHLIFLANTLTLDPINIEFSTITDIWMRRYQHQENALEFFLESNNSKLFIFHSNADRSILVEFFADKVVQCPNMPKLSVLIQQWREGQLSNWEYLTALNQISGRTYQDLMQYPIFPWILSDYESSTLNLNDQTSFRKLEKPIAVQTKESESHFINNYEYLSQAFTPSSGNCQMAPYHYGSHYSNSGTVLHFLVRIPPFTKFFLRYQDDNFDLPDRTFHSLKTTWRLASKDSPTDVKELIPEFFCLPEIFENSEGFNFGARQSGEMVNHVTLPTWSLESYRFFILIHRQALECQIVRDNLHQWIDLTFGCKQTGAAAVDAINVFHPATYIGFSAKGISDPVEKMALETMIRTYGQMPRQLIDEPHPPSYPSNEISAKMVDIYPTIKGLRWGFYTGSPQLPEPRICCFYQQFEILFDTLISLPDTNVLYGVPKGCNVMQGCDADTMNLIQWNESDGVVRIKPFCDDVFIPQPLIQDCTIDQISACGTDPQSSQLWFGHKSGRITVYESVSSSHSRLNKNRFFNHSSSFTKMSYNSAFRKISSKDVDKFSDNLDMKMPRWKMPVVLIRHTNEVTAIEISKDFKIVVSVAKDGLAVIWDSNRLQYVRSIEPICKTPISLMAISPTLGDIVTVHALNDTQSQTLIDDNDSSSECLEATENIEDFVNIPINLTGKKSIMRLHTINAKYVNHITMTEKINVICYSSIKEGTGINVIATAIDDGIIRLWSSWDLSLIREIYVGKVNIISLKYSTYQHLIVLSSDNVIQIWESAGLQESPPKFPQIFFHKRSSV